MSVSTKYQLSRIVVVCTVPATLYIFSRMVPAGMNGDTRTAAIWFAVCCVVLTIGIGSYLIMRYNKARLENPGHNELEILSAAAAQMADEKRAAESAKSQHRPTAPTVRK